MDYSGIIKWNFQTTWFLTALHFIITFTVIALADNSFNSHKVHGISNIPWNILLDPNYTSHKISSENQTFRPPLRLEYSASNGFTHHPHHSYGVTENSANSVAYYVPAPTTHHPQDHTTLKYSIPYLTSELKPQRIRDHQYSLPIAPKRPAEKVVFPQNSGYENNRPDNTQNYNSGSRIKNKVESKDEEIKKQKNRKPVDYFEAEDDDYVENFYNDYDYVPENERLSYKPSKSYSRPSSSGYKGAGDPLGLLPSASDPNGFFAKAKDLLRGGSYGRPSYSANTADYYPNYQSNKHYEEPDPYSVQSYYNQDAVGNPSYAGKGDYYGSPGYDYDTAFEDNKYGGVISYPDRRKGSKYGPLAFALGLLPLGLLLASLVPTVVTIPVTTAVATGRRRKRSIQFVNPVLDTISEYGVSALEDPMCLNRIFCQVVRDGQQEKSSIVQKLYYKLAYMLDEKIADYVGMKLLLLAVRKDQCHLFPCNVKNSKSSET